MKPAWLPATLSDKFGLGPDVALVAIESGKRAEFRRAELGQEPEAVQKGIERCFAVSIGAHNCGTDALSRGCVTMPMHESSLCCRRPSLPAALIYMSQRTLWELVKRQTKSA